MGLLKLLHGIWFMYFLPFAEQNQNEVWPWFLNLLIRLNPIIFLLCSCLLLTSSDLTDATLVVKDDNRDGCQIGHHRLLLIFADSRSHFLVWFWATNKYIHQCGCQFVNIRLFSKNLQESLDWGTKWNLSVVNTKFATLNLIIGIPMFYSSIINNNKYPRFSRLAS